MCALTCLQFFKTCNIEFTAYIGRKTLFKGLLLVFLCSKESTYQLTGFVQLHKNLWSKLCPRKRRRCINSQRLLPHWRIYFDNALSAQASGAQVRLFFRRNRNFGICRNSCSPLSRSGCLLFRHPMRCLRVCSSTACTFWRIYASLIDARRTYRTMSSIAAFHFPLPERAAHTGGENFILIGKLRAWHRSCTYRSFLERVSEGLE